MRKRRRHRGQRVHMRRAVCNIRERGRLVCTRSPQDRGDGQKNEYSGAVRRAGASSMPGRGSKLYLSSGRTWQWYGTERKAAKVVNDFFVHATSRTATVTRTERSQRLRLTRTRTKLGRGIGERFGMTKMPCTLLANVLY